MASHSLPPTPYDLCGYAIRLTDPTAYSTSMPDWIFPGIPIITGVAPTAMAAQYNVPLRVDPNYGTITDVPCVAVYNQFIGNSGVPADITSPGGFVGGRHWTWQCSVELYEGAALPPPGSSFSIKTGVYTGNGSTQVITTGFDLLVNGAVLVKPYGVGGGGAFRNSTSAVSRAVNAASDPTQMITSLSATGFTVGNAQAVNSNGQVYIYIAISNPDRGVFRVGSYTGTYGGGASPGPRTISVGSPQITPTHVWNFGGAAMYASNDMPSGTSVQLSGNAGGNSLTLINGIGLGQFSVDGGSFLSNNGLGGAGSQYEWMALAVTPAMLASMFRSGSLIGNGGTVPISGVPFTPGMVFTQEYIGAAYTGDGLWRAQNVQGSVFPTESSRWSATSLNDGGITSLTADGFTVGATGAPTGVTDYWFLFLGGLGSSGAGNPDGPFHPQCPGTTGNVSIPYFAQLSASGGTPPYMYTLIAGALPPGLILNPTLGQIYGTPTTPGSYAFTIEVHDATLAPGTFSSVTCSITISGGVSPPTCDLPVIPGGGQGCRILPFVDPI